MRMTGREIKRIRVVKLADGEPMGARRGGSEKGGVTKGSPHFRSRREHMELVKAEGNSGDGEGRE